MWRIIPSISVALLLKFRKTAAESLDTKYHIETATCHKLDIDSGRTKDSGARLTYDVRNYVTTLIWIHIQLAPGSRSVFRLKIFTKTLTKTKIFAKFL
jgi:hypothetical protein